MNNKLKKSFVLRFLKRHWLLLLILVIVSLTAALLEGLGISLVFPVLQGMTGTALTNVPFPFNKIVHLFAGMSFGPLLRLVVIILFSVTLIKAGFLYLSVILAARLKILAIKESREECIEQIMKVGISYFHKQKNAYFHLIFSNHTETAVGATINLVGTGLAQLFTTVILFGFLLMLSWRLTLISIFLVVVSSLIVRTISNKVLDNGKLLNAARHSLNSTLFDIFNGMKLIRQFNREETMIGKYCRNTENFNKVFYRATKLSQLVGPVFESTGIGILSLILIVGSFIVAQNNAAWIGILFTFVVVLNRLIVPVKSINQTLVLLFERIPMLRELDLFLSHESKSYIKNGTRVFQGMRQGIEVQNLEFSYNSDDAVVLKNVSFSIPRGAKIGIVGPSGSGKSTITELLMRFYDPQRGRIFVDRVDLRDLDLQSWRKRIGVVSQDTFLFNDTIKANITFAKPDASREEMELAARRAHIHEFIQSLPDGYDTFIGERGVLLSGGQRQRLAIARAIITEPEILIFDEATSALDTESEQIVQSALDEIAKGRTVISIAHRLSTVRDSDMIVVIDNGCIIETGKHFDLLNNHGLYRKLVKMQNLEPESVMLVKKSNADEAG
jgi:subfamily B ATP-binding cassette protein MsbA